MLRVCIGVSRLWAVGSGSGASSSSGGSGRLARWARLHSTTPPSPTLPSVTDVSGLDDADAEKYAKEVQDVLKDYDERKQRRQALVGTIVSTKNTKTITVQVVREKFFPKYNKSLSARKKIMAHDEEQRGSLGDLVRIVPCRPMSKMKRHSLIDILKKNSV